MGGRPTGQSLCLLADVSFPSYLSDGLAAFHHFLKSEFSEENLDFWLAVERFKKTRHISKMAARAAEIYDEFISTSGGRQVHVSLSVFRWSYDGSCDTAVLCLQVNVDSSVRELTKQSLHLVLNPSTFQLAQDQIFCLMETDSYPRFLRSRLYAQLANLDDQTVTESAS